MNRVTAFLLAIAILMAAGCSRPEFDADITESYGIDSDGAALYVAVRREANEVRLSKYNNIAKDPVWENVVGCLRHMRVLEDDHLWIIETATPGRGDCEYYRGVNRLMKLDLTSGETLATTEIAKGLRLVGIVEGNLWLYDEKESVVAKVDSSSLELEETYVIAPEDLTIGDPSMVRLDVSRPSRLAGDYLYLDVRFPETVAQFSLETGEVVGTVDEEYFDDYHLQILDVVEGEVWIVRDTPYSDGDRARWVANTLNPVTLELGPDVFYPASPVDSLENERYLFDLVGHSGGWDEIAQVDKASGETVREFKVITGRFRTGMIAATEDHLWLDRYEMVDISPPE